MLALSILAVSLGSSEGLDTQLLQERIAKLEKSISAGRLGVAIKDLSSGQVWSYRGSELFPMQSVFKLPLGFVVLRKADRRELDLTAVVQVGPKQLSVPYSRINEEVGKGSRSYTVEQLLKYSVQSSDNTAADLLMEMSGGPARVTSELRSVGVGGVRIDRYEKQFQLESSGLGSFRQEWTLEKAMAAAIASVPVARQRKAIEAYLADPRDTATPLGMAGFLGTLYSGRHLSKSSHALLMKMCIETTTGRYRLKAGLPKGSTLIHKTGTGRVIGGRAGAVNDVGIAVLPNGRKIIIVAFLAGAKGTEKQREGVLANVARAATDATR